MKTSILVLPLFISLALAATAKARTLTIQQCRGNHPVTNQALLLTFKDNAMEEGDRIDFTTLDGKYHGKDLGAYSVTRVYPYNFSTTRYELGLDGGFSYGAVRIREDYFTKELSLEVQAGHLVKSTSLKCQ